jgi:hypothetical protein
MIIKKMQINKENRTNGVKEEWGSGREGEGVRAGKNKMQIHRSVYTNSQIPLY